MFYNHVFTGLMVILAGIGLIVLSWIFKLTGMPDILLGYYTGPIVILIGGGILVRGKDKEK